MDCQPVLHGVAFLFKEQVCKLEVPPELVLHLHDQVQSVALDAFAHLGWYVSCVLPREQLDRIVVVHTLVTPCLDYCNTLYVECS